jgi:hypothetical protein
MACHVRLAHRGYGPLQVTSRCLASPRVASRCVASCCLASRCLASRCLASCCLALPRVALPRVASRCLALPRVALRCLASRCLALPRVALRCVALRCVALRCVALRCVALRRSLAAHAIRCGRLRGYSIHSSDGTRISLRALSADRSTVLYRACCATCCMVRAHSALQRGRTSGVPSHASCCSPFWCSQYQLPALRPPQNLVLGRRA